MKYLLLAILLIITSNANCEIYKWKDKDGNIHYSDKPAKNSDSSVVEVESKSITPNENKQRLLRQKQAIKSLQTGKSTSQANSDHEKKRHEYWKKRKQQKQECNKKIAKLRKIKTDLNNKNYSDEYKKLDPGVLNGINRNRDSLDPSVAAKKSAQFSLFQKRNKLVNEIKKNCKKYPLHLVR